MILLLHTGIPGDGRCLFRAVAHGACIRSGKPAPSESLQRELADELRARVCFSAPTYVICYSVTACLGARVSFFQCYHFVL